MIRCDVVGYLIEIDARVFAIWEIDKANTSIQHTNVGSATIRNQCWQYIACFVCMVHACFVIYTVKKP